MDEVARHYEEVLARHYTWLFGGLESNVARNEAFFRGIALAPASADPDDTRAVDLGCGPGFQAIALANLGYNVLAIDTSEALLAELRFHAAEGRATTGDPKIRAICDDLLHFERHLERRASVVVCMGDTLTHLDGTEAVSVLLNDVYANLRPEGRFVVSFRDYTAPLSGIERFIPVRSDEDTLFTCFLEYAEDHVAVHDLVYERRGSTWDLYKGSYRKIRLSPAKFSEMLKKEGFDLETTRVDGGMVTLVARRP